MLSVYSNCLCSVIYACFVRFFVCYLPFNSLYSVLIRVISLVSKVQNSTGPLRLNKWKAMKFWWNLYKPEKLNINHRFFHAAVMATQMICYLEKLQQNQPVGSITIFKLELFLEDIRTNETNKDGICFHINAEHHSQSIDTFTFILLHLFLPIFSL